MKRRLLLAEDNLLLLDIMQKRLESIGYDVITARDGLEAFKMATSEFPDLIIMDIAMPKIDGLQVASRIRKNPNTQAIRILAATAMNAPGDREKCLAAGCDGYVAKPFTFQELRAAIENLLKGE